MADDDIERANAIIGAAAAGAPEAWTRQIEATKDTLAAFGPVPERVEVTYESSLPPVTIAERARFIERLEREACEHDFEPYDGGDPAEVCCRKCTVIVGADGPRFEDAAYAALAAAQDDEDCGCRQAMRERRGAEETCLHCHEPKPPHARFADYGHLCADCYSILPFGCQDCPHHDDYHRDGTCAANVGREIAGAPWYGPCGCRAFTAPTVAQLRARMREDGSELGQPWGGENE